jgi:hypothetical protein
VLSFCDSCFVNIRRQHIIILNTCIIPKRNTFGAVD